MIVAAEVPCEQARQTLARRSATCPTSELVEVARAPRATSCSACSSASTPTSSTSSAGIRTKRRDIARDPHGAQRPQARVREAGAEGGGRSRRRPSRQEAEEGEEVMTETQNHQDDRGVRRELIGMVTSDKMDKTVVVTVIRRVASPVPQVRDPPREVQGARREERVPGRRPRRSSRRARCRRQALADAPHDQPLG